MTVILRKIVLSYYHLVFDVWYSLVYVLIVIVILFLVRGIYNELVYYWHLEVRTASHLFSPEAVLFSITGKFTGNMDFYGGSWV